MYRSLCICGNGRCASGRLTKANDLHHRGHGGSRGKSSVTDFLSRRARRRFAKTKGLNHKQHEGSRRRTTCTTGGTEVHGGDRLQRLLYRVERGEDSQDEGLEPQRARRFTKETVY